MEIKFVFEKETKNTIRFAEVPSKANGSVAIGTLYVSKPALNKLQYKDGQTLIVELKVND